MKKVTSTYYVNECNTASAAMEVFMDVFDINFIVTDIHHDGDLFWVDDVHNLFVTEVAENLMRVDVLVEV